ncbi:MAG TPA: alpha/beta hydrolase [Mycobacteriales bacterium]|nr:alpha/beta hydrolase [Mycobacteriales bacterium]
MPNLVLVHGTAATSEQWKPLTDAVSDRFTVIAPDYSGSDAASLADLAEEIVAAAGDQPFHLVGHSLGACVSALIAAEYPERVESLVLHAGWAVTDTRLDAEFRYWLELLAAPAGPELFARMLPLMAFGPRYWTEATPVANETLVIELAGAVSPGAARQTEINRGVDLRPVLGRITAPTLVLASTHDRIIEPAQQQALLAGIRNSRYAEIDAGHGAPAEDPKGFTGKIAAFLDEQAHALR